MEPYETFLMPFDNTKLNLYMHKDPVKTEKKYIASDDEEAPNS